MITINQRSEPFNGSNVTVLAQEPYIIHANVERLCVRIRAAMLGGLHFVETVVMSGLSLGWPVE